MNSKHLEASCSDHVHSCSGKATENWDARVLVQKLCVGFFCWSVMGIIWSWAAIILLVRVHVLVAAAIVIYLTYAWTVGFKAAERLGPHPVLRGWSGWRHMRDYFQAELHKTVDLDPKGTYIFAMAPHGITALSAWIGFATEATGFSDLFPGIHVRCLTLDANFHAPLIREYCLACGLRSAGRSSIKNILASGPGSAVMLVPGGAAEALLAAPGTCDVLMARRKGFVKLAIETGASLVPVLAFGENEAFDTYIPERGSLAEKAIKLLKKYCGIATPVFSGVGLAPGSWGLLPKGVPLHTLVGAPLAVPQYQARGAGDEHMHALVEEVHGRFLAALQGMWEAHKEQYAAGRRREMCFVE